MDSKSLPTKAAHDARHEPILREGLAKDERSAERLVAQRAHLPGKAAFDERLATQEGKSEARGGDQPPHRPVDQQPPERGGPRGGGGEYYVRLTVRVDDGTLSIVDSHTVDGPLAQTNAFHGPYAYEVTDGGRLLHAGAIPDLGMVRAFADPDGTPEQHRHHSYQQTSYEFDVRVPAAARFPVEGGLKFPLGCLTQARYGIAWGALGALETCLTASLEYTKTRETFGRPIAARQLVQHKLTTLATQHSLGLLMARRLGQLKDAGEMSFAQVSMAKRNNVRVALEGARLAREMHGGNGITTEYPVIRHMLNLETVDTYEGTHDIHTLIVGRDLTGENALG